MHRPADAGGQRPVSYKPGRQELLGGDRVVLAFLAALIRVKTRARQIDESHIQRRVNFSWLLTLTGPSSHPPLGRLLDV